ncbi:MAG: hypothetical protein WCE21_02910 [Candidatus Babeliales bacterium]
MSASLVALCFLLIEPRDYASVGLVNKMPTLNDSYESIIHVNPSRSTIGLGFLYKHAFTGMYRGKDYWMRINIPLMTVWGIDWFFWRI